MEIDLKHLAKCLRNDGNPDFTYIGQHFGVTPGWGDLADELLRLTARIAALEAAIEAADCLAALVDDEEMPDWMVGEGRANEINTHDWLGIRKASATYRAAKEALNAKAD